MAHTLLSHVERYIRARDMSAQYANNLRADCRAYARWMGRSVHIGELNCDDVNDWLAALQRELKPQTVDSYRRHLLAVWRDAFMQGFNDEPPLRVRRIKLPRAPVRAYTQSEILRLIHAAAQLKGRHRNGNRRADFWLALLFSAYSTGLRRGDLLLVFRDMIEPDGSATIVQSKTGIQVRVKFSADALQYAARLESREGLLLPWPYRRDALVPRFNALRKMAGLNRGTLKWIRRSAGSLAERERPGDGARLLGHSPHVFRSNYEDRSITQAEPVQPPPL